MIFILLIFNKLYRNNNKQKTEEMLIISPLNTY